MKYDLKYDLKQITSMYPQVSQLLNNSDWQNQEYGQYNLTNNDYYVYTEYNMRSTSEQFFESHRDYIDIHLILSGHETFAINHIDNLKPTTNYDKATDTILYDKVGPIDKLKTIYPGQLIIFDVNNAHMNAIGDLDDQVKKVIIKIKK